MALVTTTKEKNMLSLSATYDQKIFLIFCCKVFNYKPNVMTFVSRNCSVFSVLNIF